MDAEPVEEIKKAFLIWSLDADRDTLNAARQKSINAELS